MTLVFSFGKNTITVSFVFVDVTGLAAGGGRSGFGF